MLKFNHFLYRGSHMSQISLLQLIVAVFLSSVAAICSAGTVINTTGSDDGTAISGFDAVAFFTQKKAIQGQMQWAFQHQGAKWLFSSEENREAFSKAPEKFMPEWGGQCAWCVSENCLSPKKVNGTFDIIKGKLFLYSPGSETVDGARNAFWRSGGGTQLRIPAGDRNWLELQKRLEDDSLKQRNASNYRKTPFD